MDTNYELRREKLLSRLEDNSLCVIYAGVEKSKGYSDTYPFQVNSDFFYFTGIEQENSALFLVKTYGNTKCYLFIDEYNETKEKWYGKKLTIDEAKKISGIHNILFTNGLDAKIDLALNNESDYFGEISNLYLPLAKEVKIGEELSLNEKCKIFKEKYPNIKVNNAREIITRLRMIKDDSEIAFIREALEATKYGLNEIVLMLEPKKYEYQVAATFEYAIRNRFDFFPSFNTIVASGKNAPTLHYPCPKDILNDGDLILLDLGAASEQYHADISRTYPINGKFNDLQKKVYNIVLECNKNVIKMIKPGITISALQEYATSFMASQCVLKGLISKPEDIINHYYHNVSHHLGLETHDSSIRNLPLEVNNVITVEPGLYFKQLGIGIRIEDDVLVGEENAVCLSQDIAKEISDIEEMFANR